MKNKSKNIVLVKNTAKRKHWVGDGFHVLNLLRPDKRLQSLISPFILMDYASPKTFFPSKKLRGVGVHPHRGFETVTFAIQGEIVHRDSSGGGGLIEAGDVQWMTAGSGIIHKEYHSEKFSKLGGAFEMIQLWINLPKKYKRTPPSYQNIKNKIIPKLRIGKNSQLKLVAGKYKNISGPANTFTEINIYELKSKRVDELSFNFNKDTNSLILIMKGKLNIGNKEYANNCLLILNNKIKNIEFKVSHDFHGLLLNGMPIKEPMFSYGPFVMNTAEEIKEAIEDYQNGNMGKIDLD